MAKSIIVVTSNTKTLLTFRYDFLKALKETGATVTALGPKDSTYYDALEKLKEIGVSFEKIPIQNTGLNPWKDFKTYQSLYKFFRDTKVDGVFLYTLKPIIYGALAAHHAGVQTIVSMVTGLGHLYTFNTLKVSILRRVSDILLRWAFRGTHSIFFQNQDDASVFLKRRLVQPKQIFFVKGSGVNLDTFRLHPLPPGPPYLFLFVGRLLESKGFYEYCEAAQIVKSRFPGVRFQVLGGAHSNPAALPFKKAQSVMEKSGVEYLGEVDDVHPYLEKAHVVVLPSYREGTPKALLEALAVGRPIITTDAPGCRETVQENLNGLLVPVKDGKALAQAMITLLETPERLPEMGIASRSLAEERFDVQTVNNLLLEKLLLSRLSL